MYEFLECMSLDPESDLKHYTIHDYTFVSNINGSKSVLDRIVCSRTLSDQIISCKIDYSYHQSDHLVCNMACDLDHSSTSVSADREPKNCIDWAKIKSKHIKAYHEKAHKAGIHARKLYDLNGDANRIIEDTMASLDYAAKMSIPKRNKTKNDHAVAGWYENIQPIKNAIDYWRDKADSSKHAKQMFNKSKAKYKLAVRKLIHEKQTRIANKVAMKKSEVYRFTRQKGRNIIPPSRINGAKGDDQLEMWYSHFYNELEGRTKPSNAFRMARMTEKHLNPIQFTIADLEQVIRNDLSKSLHKAYEHNHHVLHAPLIAKENILIGLNKWCEEATNNDGIRPFEFLMSTMTPIPKTGTRNFTNVKSWRPICCSSTVCLILEKMLLVKLKPYLGTEDCQFAYKENHGCIQPISIVREAESKVSDFHVALLDATAAFDRISWKRIKKELESRNIPLSLQCVIFTLMENTSFRIKWKDQTSNESFFATKGVKQGGCISALIFACCYDELIMECNKSSAGIMLHGTKVSILVYADDILLLATSPFGMKSLLTITDTFCQKHKDIQINSSKSAILRMGKKGRKKKAISINGIPAKDSAMYLGVCINDDVSEESRVVRSLFGRVNNLLRQNKQINLCSVESKRLLANAYGSIYGLEAMSHVSSKISNAHRYLIKNIFNDQWRKYADLSNPNGWIDIRSRTLYVVFDVRCVGESYRIQRNNLILRSRKANNTLVKNVLGNMDTR